MFMRNFLVITDDGTAETTAEAVKFIKERSLSTSDCPKMWYDLNAHSELLYDRKDLSWTRVVQRCHFGRKETRDRVSQSRQRWCRYIANRLGIKVRELESHLKEYEQCRRAIEQPSGTSEVRWLQSKGYLLACRVVEHWPDLQTPLQQYESLEAWIETPHALHMSGIIEARKAADPTSMTHTSQRPTVQHWVVTYSAEWLQTLNDLVPADPKAWIRVVGIDERAIPYETPAESSKES